MTRTEIRNAAKSIVANHGPYQTYDSGNLFADERYPDASAADRAAVAEEAYRQADRVLEFLGL